MLRASYLSRSVKTFPDDEEAADPGHGQVDHQLAADAADLVDALADLEDLVAILGNDELLDESNFGWGVTCHQGLSSIPPEMLSGQNNCFRRQEKMSG